MKKVIKAILIIVAIACIVGITKVNYGVKTGIDPQDEVYKDVN